MKAALHNGWGAIFDLDGTLLDTLDDLAATGNHVLKKYGFAPVPAEGFRYYVGSGMRNMIRLALGASLRHEPHQVEITDDLISEMLEQAVNYYMDNWHNETRLYVGIDKMLAELVKRRIPLCICSNKDDAFVKKTVRRFFPDVPFIETLGQREDVPLKPDVTGAMFLADTMGVRPQDVVFIGDTRVDMHTANNAGMFAVGVSWGFRPKEELLEHGARLVIDAPEELLRCFG